MKTNNVYSIEPDCISPLHEVPQYNVNQVIIDICHTFSVSEDQKCFLSIKGGHSMLTLDADTVSSDTFIMLLLNCIYFSHNKKSI